MLQYASAFVRHFEPSRALSYRPAAMRFNSLATVFSAAVNSPRSLFVRIGRLNPFFSALRVAQAFPMAALLHGRPPFKPSTEKE